MKISLARANLIHDWRRHATAIVVLVLAGLLMTTQLGFVAGFIESQGQLQRELRADVMIIHKRAPGPGAGRIISGGGRRLESRHEGQIWMHPEVDLVQGYSPVAGAGVWQSEGGSRKSVRFSTMDPAEGSMTFPKRFPDSLREMLATPGMVVLPRSSARTLGAELGDTATINKVRVTVAGIVDGLSGGFFASVFTSPQTARLISPDRQNRWVGSFLVKLKNPQLVDQVIPELNQSLAAAGLEAVRPKDYASGEGVSQLLTSSFGWILMGSAIFGLIVGCGVASQTLRGAFLAQLTEFGALRALGVSKGRMALVALEQAWWTGLLSIPIAAILAHGIRLLAMQFDLTIALPNGLLMATSTLLLIVALFAGLISLTAVTRVEPAELLR